MIASGSADRLTVGSALTVTIAVSDRSPYAFEAVMVYVVVTTGDTTNKVVPVTSMGPGSRISVSAPVEVHTKLADSPSAIAAGTAEILTVGRLFTVTVTPALTSPYAFDAVRV